VSDGAVDYESALATMSARAEAIARGESRELIWLLEHPPSLHRRQPVHRRRSSSGRDFRFMSQGVAGSCLSWPGQRVGYVMVDLNLRAPNVRSFVATIEEWIIRALAVFNVQGERREIESAFGCGGRTRARASRTRSPRSAFACSTG